MARMAVGFSVAMAAQLVFLVWQQLWDSYRQVQLKRNLTRSRVLSWTLAYKIVALMNT